MPRSSTRLSLSRARARARTANSIALSFSCFWHCLCPGIAPHPRSDDHHESHHYHFHHFVSLFRWGRDAVGPQFCLPALRLVSWNACSLFGGSGTAIAAMQRCSDAEMRTAGNSSDCSEDEENEALRAAGGEAGDGGTAMCGMGGAGMGGQHDVLQVRRSLGGRGDTGLRMSDLCVIGGTGREGEAMAGCGGASMSL